MSHELLELFVFAYVMLVKLSWKQKNVELPTIIVLYSPATELLWINDFGMSSKRSGTTKHAFMGFLLVPLFLIAEKFCLKC